jgi:acetyltransferase-like isoleucine patch superfamily enzyme
MNVIKAFQKISVAAVQNALILVSPRHAARFMVWYYRRRGMKILGTPNYIAPGTWFDGTDYSLIELNEGCSISMHVRFLTHDWTLFTAVRGIGLEPVRAIGSLRPIRVGRYALIGMGSLLLPGADVGDCAIVGAGSVIRGTVPPYAIFAGNPASQVGDTREYIRKNLRRLGETELADQAEKILSSGVASP